MRSSGMAVVAVLGAAASLGAMMGAGPEKSACCAGDGKKAQAASCCSAGSTVLDRKMKRIDGTEEDLSKYKGKVVLIVNTASRCGLTKQYDKLEQLYKDKKDAGFVILGFPANDFRGQEPGTNEEIAKFCTDTYGVTFPMFEKIAVTGEGTHELYAKLAAMPEPIGGEPKWNFTKFIVDREGKVVARFEPRVEPDDKDLVKKIDELLGQSKDGKETAKPSTAGA